MRLYLIGHDCRYAAEQTLLTLFPSERPEYPEGKPLGDRCELIMRRGADFTTCACRFFVGGRLYSGRAAVKNSSMTDDVSEHRLKQRIVKRAFYRAALRSGVPTPEWGALTGVRPVKLLSPILKTDSEKAALSRFRREYGVSKARADLCLSAARAAADAKKASGAGYLSVCGHSVLPHPLRLLQLRQPVRGKEYEACGAFFARTLFGYRGHSGGRPERASASCFPLSGGRHADDPFRPPNWTPSAQGLKPLSIFPPSGNTPWRPAGRTPSPKKSSAFSQSTASRG
jgi:hypothetical protein